MRVCLYVLHNISQVDLFGFSVPAFCQKRLGDKEPDYDNETWFRTRFITASILTPRSGCGCALALGSFTCRK
jgi:hypothetical protein